MEKRYTAKHLKRIELGTQVIWEDEALLYEEAPQAYKNISSVIGDLSWAGGDDYCGGRGGWHCG